MEKLFSTRSAWIMLGVIAAITLFFCTLLPGLKLDYDFEKFFPKKDPELDFYLEHRARFETDNDFLLIAIKPTGGIFNRKFLTELDSITGQLGRLANVTSIISLTTYKQPISTPFGLSLVPVVAVDEGHDYKNDSIYLRSDSLLVGNILSNDLRSTVILLRNHPKISKKNSDILLQSIEKTVQSYSFAETHLAGKIHGQYHYIKKMGRELVVFSIVSIMLLAIFLWFTFRSLWGIWVPLLIVGCTLIWLGGIVVLMGEKLSVLTTILPTIIFVVGISDTVHLVEKFIEELRLGKPKLLAIRIAYKEVGLATFFTCLTTAVGFLTLTTSSIEPINDFAIFTGIGVWLAFILSYTLLPALIILLKRPKISEKKLQDDFWNRQLHRLFVFVLNHRKGIVITVLIITSAAFIGISRVKIDNYLLEDWSKNDPERKDYFFFENNFAGVRPFEMAVTVNDSEKNILSYETLKEIDKLEIYLRTEYGIGAITSPVTLLKSLNKGQYGGDNAYFTFPSQEEYEGMLPELSKIIESGKAGIYITGDLRQCRISGRITDFGGFVFKQKNTNLNKFIEQKIDKNILRLQQTGMPMLIDKNNENLSTDMILELGLSFGFIALLMGFLFRSWPMLIISLIPNTIPLIIIGGFMGFTGIDLKVSTSIIFSIAFGIAVDDTIHFLSSLKLELSKGKSLVYAMKRTYLSTGKAVVVTGLILCSGFISLIFSSFASTFYLGLLVSLTLFIALLGDLLLLPVLILWWGKKLQKTQN